jgi:hypothetical protein
MPVQKKPFIKYSILSLLMLVVVILLLGKALLDEVNESLTKTHLRRLPETVDTIFDRHRDVTRWFLQPPGTSLPEPMVKLSEGLLNIPGVFRLKVWNTDGTILWSDHAELIGKNFAQNQHFQVASSGTVAYNNEGFQKDENQTEQGERIVVEVYLPVYDDRRIIGVLELYESNTELSSLMVRSAETVWAFLAVAGIALYLLMLAAYLLSHDIAAELSQKTNKGPDS